MVFPFFGRKKYKMLTKCGKLFNYITFLMFSKTNFQFSPFLVKFSILVKSKMAAKMADIAPPPPPAPPAPPAAPHPIIFTSSCRAHHRLSTKGEKFSKYCDIMKTQGGVPSTPPPSLYHGGSVSVLVRPRVK